MKKYVRYYIAVIALIALAPATAWAQVPSVVESQPLVNEYIADNESPRRASWWNLLGRQLTSDVDKPVADVTEQELQNIIFFATHHKDKVKLYDAVPYLLKIADSHQKEGFRIMAVSALYSIGHNGSMKELRTLLRDEPSERVQKVIKAAYADYYKL